MTAPASCPICQKPVDPKEKTFPFCSDRCRNVDLLRWFKGEYAITEPLRPDQLDLDALDEENP